MASPESSSTASQNDQLLPMPVAAQLLTRALDAAPWFAQVLAIVLFVYVLCQPVLLTPVLAVGVAVHVISFVSLCRFLSPHRAQQHKAIPPTPAPTAALSSECPDGKVILVDMMSIDKCPNDKPGISIIKPIAGTNANLRENLESCFQLTYPKLELLFCLHDADDKAVVVIEELIARYPAVDARLLYGEAELEGASPKVRNMAKGYEQAAYDIFWAIDSKIRTSDGDVDAMVASLLGDSAVGLVHQLPWNQRGDDTGSIIERMFFGGTHARAYCLINGLGLPCTIGMSLMCKRSSWSAIGGCAALSATVAEDSLIGVLMQAEGYTCAMAAVPCVQNPPPASVCDIIRRRARWYQLKVFEMDGGRWVAPFDFWLEHTSLLCLVAAQLWTSTADPCIVACGTLGVLAMCAALDITYTRLIDAAARAPIACPIGPSPPRVHVLRLAGLWLLNLLLPFAVIWRGLATSTIVWDCNGTLKPMHPKPYSKHLAEHRHEAQRSSDDSDALRRSSDALMQPSHMVHDPPTLVRINPLETA